MVINRKHLPSAALAAVVMMHGGAMAYMWHTMRPSVYTPPVPYRATAPMMAVMLTATPTPVAAPTPPAPKPVVQKPVTPKAEPKAAPKKEADPKPKPQPKAPPKAPPKTPPKAQIKKMAAVQKPSPAPAITTAKAASTATHSTTHSAATQNTANTAPADAPAVTTPAQFSAAYLNNPTPPYPPLSRRLGEQGTVLLSVLVSANGEAQRVDIRRSSGHDRLDNAALRGVEGWRFVPAKRNGQAIADSVTVPIKFVLE